MLRKCRVVLLGVATALMLGAPSNAWSQGLGSISGRVIDQASTDPLPAAQVFIGALDLGTLTDAGGRYTLSDVPTGQHTLEIQRIGYAQAQQTVTVVAGEPVVANFQLRSEALVLDAVVVTGTAGGTRQRAVGNVVERLDASAGLELAPVGDLDGLLIGRAAGVSIRAATGEIGTSAAIRIRGPNTLNLSSSPLVYIDGVRMNSEYGGDRGKTARMSDIRPEEIESIEIIKGPAASTLYGTEASAGVIQIITKRGVQGAPRFDMSIGQGVNYYYNPAERIGTSYHREDDGSIISFNIYEHETQNGLGAPFSNGPIQRYSASVTGGTDLVRYYGSASWDRDVGFVDYNYQENLGVRSNLSVLPSEDLTLNFNLSYVKSNTAYVEGWVDSLWDDIIWARPDKVTTRTRGFNRRNPEAHANEKEHKSFVNRAIVSFELLHQPTSWLTHRAIVGYDLTSDDFYQLARRSPEGALGIFGSASLGRKNTDDQRTDVLTVDYSATASFALSESITSETSVGAQHFRQSSAQRAARGEIFPAPGFETISSMALTSGSEDFTENSTIGSYAQQQFGWRDRVFVTGAVRMDDNSAFGTDFDAAVYPKASATWVMSEEPFWNPGVVNQLRLRGAWGAAGRQPDIFDAARLYDAAVGPNDQAGVVPGAFGNPDLKPERAEELEVGFDAAFVNDRIDLTYTYFRKVTTDAILAVPVAPSVGFPGAQIRNVGKLRNWGHEIALNARLVQQPSLSWEAGVQTSFLRNMVDDLGPLDAIRASDSRGLGWHRPGYPLESAFFRVVRSADLDPNGVPINIMCDGGTGPDGLQQGGPLVDCTDAPELYLGRSGHPTWELAMYSTVRYGPFRLHAQADGRGGSVHVEHGNTGANSNFATTYASNCQCMPTVEAYRAIGRNMLGRFNGGFVRLRDVSLTYDLPDALLDQMGVSNASLTLSGRNMALLWQEQKRVELPDGTVIPDPIIKDPELRVFGNRESASFSDGDMGTLKSLIATFRVSF